MLTRRAFLAAAAVAPFARRARARATYDLVVKVGRVIDPAQRVDRAADVAIAGGRIAAIRPSINADQAADVLDARGKLVTPGLIDLHVHVGAPELTPGALLRDGVTSMVDGGSAGADKIDGLGRGAEAAPNPGRIFLNGGRARVPPPGGLPSLPPPPRGAARPAPAGGTAPGSPASRCGSPSPLPANTISKRCGGRVRRPGRCR